MEEEDSVKKFWEARCRGGKEAEEEEEQVQTYRQQLTVGLRKGKFRGKKSAISN